MVTTSRRHEVEEEVEGSTRQNNPLVSAAYREPQKPLLDMWISGRAEEKEPRADARFQLAFPAAKK
jgi:hypothetical protein